MKGHRGGGKLTNSHTTAIEIVLKLVDFLEKLDSVTKITLGVIIPLDGTRKSPSRVVKLTKESTTCVLVRVTQKISVQEFRFYTNDVPVSILATARYIRNNDWELRFK